MEEEPEGADLTSQMFQMYSRMQRYHTPPSGASGAMAKMAKRKAMKDMLSDTNDKGAMASNDITALLSEGTGAGSKNSDEILRRRMLSRGKSDKVKKSQLGTAGLDAEFTERLGMAPAQGSGKKKRLVTEQASLSQQFMTQTPRYLREGADPRDFAFKREVIPPQTADISKKQWETWIRGNRNQGNENAQRHNASARRIRHHRDTCRYHPRSTDHSWRLMSLGIGFPQSSLKESQQRLLRTVNGASVKSGPPADGPPPTPDQMFPMFPRCTDRTALSSQTQRVRTASTMDFTESTIDPTSFAMEGTMRPGGMEATLRPEVREEDLSSFFMTATDVKNRPLPPLRVSTAPPAVDDRWTCLRGEWADCECSPRSTDEEDYTDSKNSANFARERLLSWRRQFALTKAQNSSTIRHRLNRREEHRQQVTDSRTHLYHVAQQSEKFGSGLSIARQTRTPNTGMYTKESIWSYVFDEMSADDDNLNFAMTLYSTFLTFCDRHGFPSNAKQEDFCGAVRHSLMKKRRFTDKHLYEILDRFGDVLLQTKLGYEAVLCIQDTMKLPARELFSFIQSKENWVLHPDLVSMIKKAANARNLDGSHMGLPSDTMPTAPSSM